MLSWFLSDASTSQQAPPRQVGSQCGSAISLGKALSRFRSAGRWRPALQEIQDAKHHALKTDLVVFNIALGAVASHGRWQLALLMTAAEKSPDTYSWNTLAGAVSKGKSWSRVLATLRLIREQQIADTVTYNTAISSLKGQPAGWFRASSLLLQASLAKLQPDVMTCSSTAACAQDMDVSGDAWRDVLVHLETSRGSSLAKSVYLWSACMTCVSRASRWATAWDLMQAARRCRLQPNVVMLCAATAAGQIGHQWQQTHTSLEAARAQELAVNDVFFGTILADTSWSRAVQWLEEMRLSTVRASSVLLAIASSTVPWEQALEALLPASAHALSAVNNVIGGCGKTACWQAAVALVHRFATEDATARVTAVGFTAAAGACERGRQRRQAVMLLKELRRRRLQGDRTSQGAAIAFSSQSWRTALWQLAVASTEEASAKGDRVMQGSAMATCGEHGKWILVMGLLDAQMPIEPVNVALEACKTKSLWTVALGLMGVALERELKLDVLTVSSTLGACAQCWEENRLWFSHLQLLDRMVLRQVRPNLLCWLEALPKEQACPMSPNLLHKLQAVAIASFDRFDVRRAA
eukprot:s2355_g9.t1